MSDLLSALVLMASTALGAKLDVSVTPRELTIGDRAEVTVSVTLPDNVPTGAVAWPEWEETLGTAEILEVGPVQIMSLKNGRRVMRQTLGVTFFEVGDAVIPAIAVEVAEAAGPRHLESHEATIEVRSVLPEDEAEPEAKPPAPPQGLEIGRPFWWASGALLATCLLAMVLLVRQSRLLPEGGISMPLLSPREELDQALVSLRDEADPQSLYDGISMTTRRFIGRSFAFPAPESTTREIARNLRAKRPGVAVVGTIDDLLKGCDMVKFARRPVSLEDGRQAIRQVRSIADEVDEILRPVEAPGLDLEERADAPKDAIDMREAD